MEIIEAIPNEGYEEFIAPLIEEGIVELRSKEEAKMWLAVLEKMCEQGAGKSFIVVEGKRLVAHGGFFNNGAGDELFIAVAATHRNRGLGKKIVEACFRHTGVLTAYCKKENEIAQAFYRHIGGIEEENKRDIIKFSLKKGIVLKTLSKNNSQKPAYNVIVMAEEKNTLEELQEKKKKLIERVKAAIKRLKYKKIELEALEKLVKDYNEEEVQKLQRTLKRLEFKIQTNALTSKTENDLIKKIVKIEKELAKWRPKIRAKRRKGYVEKDIEELEKEIEKVESELKEIRAAIKEEMRKRSAKNMAEKKGVKFADEVDSTVELTDIAVFEDG